MRARLLIAVTAVLAAVAGVTAQQVTAAPDCTIAFDGGAGTTAWGTAANWDLDRIPAATDHVCVPAGQSVVASGGITVQTIQADGSLTLSSSFLTLTDAANDSYAAEYTQTGGNLIGDGTFVLTGTATWRAGTASGAGTTRVAQGAQLTFGGGNPTLDAPRVLEVAGTATFTTANGLYDSGSAPSALVRVTPTGVVRSTATGEPWIWPALENDGVVEATAGVLQLEGGSDGHQSGGRFGVAGAGGLVRFDAGTHVLGDGAQLAGGTRVQGGAVSVASGATATASGANEMGGGALSGPGTLAVTGGTYRLAGGRLEGNGTFRVASGATMTVDGGNPTLYAGSTLEVAGLLRLLTANGLYDSGTTPEPLVRVTPTGTVRGEAAGAEPWIWAAVENDGAVEATAGTLQLEGGSAGLQSTGRYGAAGAGGVVRFDAGTHVLGDGAALAGGARVAAGTVTIADGAAASSAGANEMTGGTLAGPGRFTVASGTFRTAGGTFGGNGAFGVAAGATMTVDGGNPTLAAGSSMEVAGVLAFLTAHNLYTSGSPDPIVHVTPTGVLRNAAPTGEPSVWPGVENDGLVEAVSGTLQLDGDSAGLASTGRYGAAGAAGVVRFDAGSHELADGATLAGGTRVAGGTLAIADGATVTASGANQMSSGSFTGTGTLAVAGGTLRVSGGSMTGAGRTEVASGATLALEGGNLGLATGRTLAVAGTLDVRGDHSVTRSGTPEPLLHVEAGGVLRKTAGTGTGTIGAALRNQGVATSSSGVLALARGASAPHTGDFDGDAAGAYAELSAGTHLLDSGARLLGHADLGGATVSIAEGATVPVPEQARLSGGRLSGPGTLDVTGTMAWTGGSLQGPGTTHVAPGASVVVDSCFVDVDDDHVLDVDGTLRLVRQSDLYAYGSPVAPVIDVSGRLEIDDTEAGPCSGVNGLYGNAAVNVTGALEKVAGATQSRVDAVLDNDGTVRALAGTLELASDEPATHAGAFGAAADAGVVDFADGVFVLEPGATVAGDPTISGAEVRLPEDMDLTIGAGRVLTQTGGTLSGGGTLRVLGTLNWSDGTQEQGTTVIEPGGTAVVGGQEFSYTNLGGDRAFVNRGTLAVTQGTLYMEQGASLLNAGTAEIADTATIEGSGYYGGYGYGFDSLIHNTGVLRKAAGTGAATIRSALDNDGTVEVSAGRLNLEGWLLNTSYDDAGLNGGTWVVRDATLGVVDAIERNAAHLVLDGPEAKVMTVDPYDGIPLADALADLGRNSGAGRIELQGGRDLTLPGGFRNLGVLRLGDGSTVTVAGAFDQFGGLTELAGDTARLTATGAQVRLAGGRLTGRGSAGPSVAAEGGVIEPGLAGAGALTLDALTMGAGARVRAALAGTTPGAGFGQLKVTGAGALGGTLALATDPGFAPAAGTELVLGTFGTRTGTFAALDGASAGPGREWQVVYGATDVKLRAVSTSGLVADAPADDAPGGREQPDAGGEEPVRAPQPVRIDDAAMRASAGDWTRRTIGGRRYAVSRARGATLVRRGVRGSRISLVAATCRRCGAVKVFWRGKLAGKVSLKGRRGRRVIGVARSSSPRTGTLRIRATSARRVAVDGIVVR